MPVELTQDEINTFQKNGVGADDIQYTVDHYRSIGLSDNEIRSKIDTKLNNYYNDYTKSHQQTVIKGSVSFNDILADDKLNREQKAELIKERGEKYQNDLDRERRRNKISNIAGSGIKILSPLAGLIPFAGIPLAGSIYGLGDSIEYRNDFKTTLGKMGLYGGASYLGGSVLGKAVTSLPALKNKATDLILKSALKGGSIGVSDGLADGINRNFNSNKFNPLEISKQALTGLVGGSLLGGAGGLLSAKFPAIVPDTNESAEKLKQFLRKGIMRRRAYEDSNIFEATKLVNDFIAQTKKFAKNYNFNDKSIREIMPFIRENTALPENFDRVDLIELYNSLNPVQKNELKSLADSASLSFEKYWDEYSKLNPTVGKSKKDTYITHLWDESDIKDEKLLNYFKNITKFGKKRHINSYKQGIEGVKTPDGEILKLKPKTLDYAEILKEHADDVIRATSNLKFTNLLNKLKTPSGAPLMYSKPHLDYKEVKHPSLGKNNYIHKQYVDTLAPVLEETSSKTKAGKFYDKVNNFAKTCKFLFNGMHAVALTETAAAHEGIIPVKTFKTLTNIPKIIDGIKNNNYEVFKNEKLTKEAISDGVQFGAISDISIKDFTSSLDSVLGFLDKGTLGLSKVLTKPLKTSMDLNNKVLWNYLHNTYKLHAYKTLIERTQKQFKEPLTKEIRQEIGQIVNDTFGGQNFDTLGIKPSSVQNARRLLLSPDWNISAFIRQSLSVLSTEPSQKILNEIANKSVTGSFVREFMRKIGISSFTNDVKSAGVRGKIARQFFARFIIQSAIYANIVNVAFRSYDKLKNPEQYDNDFSDYNLYDNNRYYEDDSRLTKTTDILFPRPFVGRDQNGREKYARISKQAREVPEFIEDGAKGALRKTASKASPIVAPVATYAADKLTDGWNKASILDRYKEVFTPYSLAGSEITPLSGIYSTTKGVNFYQAKDYIKTSLKNGDISAIKEFSNKLKANNLDFDSVVKKASAELMLEALENNNKKAVENIWNDIDELGVDAHKVYRSVIYKYLEKQEDNNGKS